MAIDNPLENKVVLVTGGTSGIGAAAAELFAARGAKVALTGRREARGREVVRSVEMQGGAALFVPADHLKPEDCARSVEAVVGAWGRVDILFNNAGVVVRGTAETTSEEVWARTLALNVTAVWRMCKLVLPFMRSQGGGAIVNNASDWGLVGGRDALAYCTSKGAVVQMTRALALDHAQDGVRVNAVCPGDTFVTRWVEEGYFEGSTNEGLETLGAALPLGRVGRAEEIAEVVVFLASDAASFMTGAAVPIDGGNTAA